MVRSVVWQKKRTLEAILIYVTASMLLSACGNQDRKLPIRTSKKNEAAAGPKADNQKTATLVEGGAVALSQSGADIAAILRQTWLSGLQEAEVKNAQSLATQITQVTVLQMDQGYEVSWTETTSGAPKVEKFDAVTRQPGKSNVFEIKENSKPRLVLTELTNGRGRLEIFKEGIAIPYFYELRQAELKVASVKFDSQKTKLKITESRGLKRLAAVEQLERLNQKDSKRTLSNTINLLTLESVLAIDFQDSTSAKLLRFSGPLTKGDQTTNDLVVTKSTDDQLVAGLRSFDGETLRLSLGERTEAPAADVKKPTTQSEIVVELKVGPLVSAPEKK